MTDCITHTEKQAEYSPRFWTLRQQSETRWQAINTRTGGQLSFTVAFGRVFRVHSEQSGQTHEVLNGACTCKDFETHALKQARLCRHAAPALLLEAVLDRQREAEARDFATPNKFANRVATLTATIAAAQEAARAIVENELGCAA